MPEQSNFKPFVPAETTMAELTIKSIITGALFGIIFGASTVYLALKAGLTVSASIPIAVIAITLGRRFLKTTILENNIIQTTGSAGESIAAGGVFTGACIPPDFWGGDSDPCTIPSSLTTMPRPARACCTAGGTCGRRMIMVPVVGSYAARGFMYSLTAACCGY